MFESITNGISNSISGGIKTGISGIYVLVLNLIQSLMGGSSSLVGSSLGIRDGISSYLTNFYSTISLIYGAALLVIVLYKIAKSLIGISTGANEHQPIGQIMWDAIKASVGSIVLPWLLGMFTAFLPLFQILITSSIVDTSLDKISTLIVTIQDGGYEAAFLDVSQMPSILLFFVFVAVTNLVFYFTVCKYQVDLILLELMTPAAAIDCATVSKEFFTTWKRTIVSIFISMICKVLLNGVVCIAFVKILEIDAYDIMSYNLWNMVLIGCGVCLIKEPEIVKTYKYSSGAGQGIVNLAKTAVMVVR